jgi:class 3 adenylate cyclase
MERIFGLSSALQQALPLGEPGQILISKRVLAMTEELLRVESAGALSLKGFHRPIPAYDVVGLRP